MQPITQSGMDQSSSKVIHSAQAMNMTTRFTDLRAQTVQWLKPLSAEDCCAQSMPDCSPAKWHLAHTTWFFETFVLARFEPDFRAFDPSFRVLFNSYYNGVGAKHPRPQRGLLTRPDLETVLRYREQVDERIVQLLSHHSNVAPMLELLELGLQHEQQHQELLRTDVKHLLSCHPLWPAYQDHVPAQALSTCAPDIPWFAHEGGLVRIGHQGDGFAFDNESPRHTTYLQPFELASRLVTNAQFLAFVEDGGYRDPNLWLAEGWDWVCANRIEVPLYWRQQEPGDEWQEFSLHGAQLLNLHEPVTHLSYFEADAFARWADARLPTEAEWEAIAQSPNYNLAQAQMFGHVWQWTSSSYAAYPGFQPAEGAVGEYNGKFMVNQYVLRGSSCATPDGHARTSYRNFFPTTARWQFTGLRLARG